MAGENDLITLIDEEGNEHEFSVLDILEVEEEEYAILIPVASGEEADEVVIFKFSEDEEGNEVLIDLEDEEWEKVADAWQEKVGNEH